MRRSRAGAMIAIGMMMFFILPARGVRAQSKELYNQKAEFERIQREIEASRQSLDSLQKLEKKVLKDIADYEQRATMGETVVRRLRGQLSDIRADIGDSRRRLEETETRQKATRSRYLKGLRLFYAGMRWSEMEADDALEAEAGFMRRLIYLRSLTRYDRAKLSQASDFLAETEKEYNALLDREKKVSRTHSKKSSEYASISAKMKKRERELSKVRREKESEADRLSSLSEAARQMEQVMARLESARSERRAEEKSAGPGSATGNFTAYKGKMPGPMPGSVVSAHGWSTNKVTKLKSYSPGIEIRGKKNAAVVAVADGAVAYVGTLRGYGTFVILEHEDGYYTTYAGLDEVGVALGQQVGREERLGRTASGTLKFELRQGKESLDPVEWIKIDFFK